MILRNRIPSRHAEAAQARLESQRVINAQDWVECTRCLETMLLAYFGDMRAALDRKWGFWIADDIPVRLLAEQSWNGWLCDGCVAYLLSRKLPESSTAPGDGR